MVYFTREQVDEINCGLSRISGVRAMAGGSDTSTYAQSESMQREQKLRKRIAELEEERDKYRTALEFIAESRKKQDAFGAIHISRESYTPVHDDSDMWNAALDALGIP